MKTLILKEEKKLHFKAYARDKVRELGVDGAVDYFRTRRDYYRNNKIYEMSWIRASVYDMIIDYIVNDLTE